MPYVLLSCPDAMIKCPEDKHHEEKWFVCLIVPGYSPHMQKSQMQKLEGTSDIDPQSTTEREWTHVCLHYLIFANSYKTQKSNTGNGSAQGKQLFPSINRIKTIPCLTAPRQACGPTWSRHSLHETSSQVILDYDKLTIKTNHNAS